MSVSISKYPTVTIVSGPNQGARITLDHSPFTFGRDPSSDYAIDVQHKISRQHARIYQDGARWAIVDLGSKNGTFVKGTRLIAHQPRLLEDRDLIQLSSMLTFQFADPDTTVEEIYVPVYTPGIWLDVEHKEVWFQAEKCCGQWSDELFNLLCLFYEKAGELVSNDEIKAVLWPGIAGDLISAQDVDAYVYRLRQKLKELDPDHEYIRTSRGQGRIFVQPEPAR